MSYRDLDWVKVVDDIAFELNVLRDEGVFIPEQVWLSSKWWFGNAVRLNNIFYCDFGVKFCHEHNFTPTKTMLDIITRTANMRLDGSPAGTVRKIQKDTANDMLYQFVCHCLAAGLSLATSCKKAAVLYTRLFPQEKPKMASSIEESFSKKYRKNGEITRTEMLFRKDHLNDPKLTTDILSLADNLGECPEELLGNLR